MKPGKTRDAADPPTSLTSTTLAALIDSGYSRQFGIQLYFAEAQHEPEIYTFDDEDRSRWGDTEMFVCRLHLRKDKGNEATPGYASRWISSLFRLICMDDKQLISRS
jgi:hypothetical protein